MDKPYIICHMVISLDGKVTGDFLAKSRYSSFIEDYYRIHREFAADAFLCGRITMAESFPQPADVPAIYSGLPFAPEEDYIAGKAGFYAVAVDPQGKLYWNDRVIADPDEGYNGAHIIEVLTQKVSTDFLAHLRAKGVSYIFGGKTELDVSLVVRKLKQHFGIKKLLLEGGGIVNGSFLQEGLIDEISLVIVPAVESESKSVPLFHTGNYQTGAVVSADFRLKEATKLENGGLWLKYQK